MELLKRILLTITLSACVVVTNAQSFEETLEAFSKSYQYEKQGDYTKAIDVLKAVYQEDAYEQSLRLGWLNYLNGNFTESASHYHHALELKPYCEEARFGIILPLSASGKWEEVLKLYDEILDNNPNNTKASYRLGLIYFNRGAYEKAAPYFQKVVDLYPFDYDGVIMMAWTNLNLSKNREARILFQKSLLLRPGDPSATDGLSRIP